MSRQRPLALHTLHSSYFGGVDSEGQEYPERVKLLPDEKLISGQDYAIREIHHVAFIRMGKHELCKPIRDGVYPRLTSQEIIPWVAKQSDRVT